MIFHEIYGCYYRCVAIILNKALNQELDDEKMHDIIMECAFPESFLIIEPALRHQQWPLLCKDGTTPLQHVCTRPLTLLQKRWLKAISLDPRIVLFEVNWTFLEEIEPLYMPDDIVYYDQLLDRDNYNDATYQKVFHTIRYAIQQHRSLLIKYVSGKGKHIQATCTPIRLEYSTKDDKFRLYAFHHKQRITVNLSRIISVEMEEVITPQEVALPPICKRYVLIELIDERKALERVMLHFAHFEKRAIRLDENRYQIRIKYERDDETELIIRVLSFGPFVKVVEPDYFLSQIKQRLLAQKSCGHF